MVGHMGRRPVAGLLAVLISVIASLWLLTHGLAALGILGVFGGAAALCRALWPDLGVTSLSARLGLNIGQVVFALALVALGIVGAILSFRDAETSRGLVLLAGSAIIMTPLVVMAFRGRRD